MDAGPYIAALIAIAGALFVGAINQWHRTIEKRMDELYSPLYRFAWLDRDSFPKQGEKEYERLLNLLHRKNYLMSHTLHSFYYANILVPKPAQGIIAGSVAEDLQRIVRSDYERIRRQYLSYRGLLRGLLKPSVLGYKETYQAAKCPKCGLEQAPTLQLCVKCGANLWP